MSELVSYMWADGVSFSYCKFGEDMQDSDEVSLKWDKWLDDPRWRAHAKCIEWINLEWTILERVRSEVSGHFFELCKAHHADDVLTIHIDDGAVVMDRRAFARATYLIAGRTEGWIYSPCDQNALDASEYYQANRSLIESEFTPAVRVD